MRSDAIKTAIGFSFIALGLALAVFILYTFFAPDNKVKASEADVTPLPVVVIDPGHGGADGGAVGVDGVLEKELNLEIALTLSELMKISGYNTVMTRTDDIMLSPANGAGSAKMQDLRERLNIASSYPDALTVSIHCNKFPSEKCTGLQVYYSEFEEAKQAADDVQAAVIKYLQPENHRATKKADSSIYLLYRAKSPTILVECGFLSNPTECQNLQSDEYRKKLALSIFIGLESDGD